MNYNLRHRPQNPSVESSISTSMSSEADISCLTSQGYNTSNWADETLEILLEKRESEKERRIKAKGDVRRVWRKTPDEISYLEHEFSKDPEWTTLTVKRCARKLGLRTPQVYKWGYDVKQQIKNRRDDHSDTSPRECKILRAVRRDFKHSLDETNDLNEYIGQLVEDAEKQLKRPTLKCLNSKPGIIKANKRQRKYSKKESGRVHKARGSASPAMEVSPPRSEFNSVHESFASEDDNRLNDHYPQNLSLNILENAINAEFSGLDRKFLKSEEEVSNWSPYSYNEESMFSGGMNYPDLDF